MPTYDYVCDACEHAFEEFQAITAKPLKKCPECAKPKLRRLIGTGAGIIFKGSGFYETDYRSEGYQKAAEADSGAGKPKEGKKDAAKPDTSANKPTQSGTKAKADKPSKPSGQSS